MNQVPGVILYIADEDLFRLGNAAEPRMDHVRGRDVEVFLADGIEWVRANGRGISLLTEARASGMRGGWLWRLPAHIPLPAGLLYNNDRPGHYALCPAYDMKVDFYKKLLKMLAERCERIEKR